MHSHLTRNFAVESGTRLINSLFRSRYRLSLDTKRGVRCEIKPNIGCEGHQSLNNCVTRKTVLLSFRSAKSRQEDSSQPVQKHSFHRTPNRVP